ncbi:MAG: ThiF family adenylyltransferase [Pirellulales bacterium]|nr:ThiF family adenylyltransferase [Pirellulales bacterium]
MTSNTPANRYARQIQFGPIGADGQALIRAADVAVLGCGALGTVAAELLARAGVGRLRLVDRDVVEWTNLQRQSLYDEDDARAGISKADASARRLSAINSSIQVHTHVVDITPDKIDSTLSGADLVIDATDNFAIRLLLNDWSLATSTAWVHGGCVGATGQVMLFDGQGRPCFRCLVPTPPPAASVPTCDTAGVIGSATHLIASLQATEAVKWISGNRDAIRRRLLSIDLWNNRIREIHIDEELHRQCRACHEHHRDFLAQSGEVPLDNASVLCGREAVQIAGAKDVMVDLQQMALRWQTLGRVQATPFFVRLHLDKHTLTLFRDGRAVVGGTHEISRARSLYDRYVGR